MGDEKDVPLSRTWDGETPSHLSHSDAEAASDAALETPGEPPFTDAAPPPAAPVKRPSAVPGLAAALLLGLIGGFGGAYAMRYIESLQGPDPVDRIAEATARADALDRKNDAATAALAALQNRVAEVEGGVKQAAASSEAAIGELRNVIESRPVAAAAADGGAADAGSAASGPEGAAPSADLSPIREKLGALEKKLGSLAAVESKLGALDAVKQKIGEIETAIATPKVDAKAEQDRAAAAASAKALAAAHSKGVVAASLVQLVTRGEPFAAEVAALDGLGADPAKIAPLRAVADKGVATIGDLAEQFAAVAPALEAPEPAPPETGFLERLARDASTLVHVRRAGDPHDTDMPGRIAAIQGALARLDVAKAYAIWTKLPDAAKAKSAAWGAAAKARLDAVAAAAAIEADAVSELGKPKS